MSVCLSLSDTSRTLFARCLSAVLTLAFHLASSSPQTRRERVRQNHRSDRSANCGGWEMWTSTFFHDPSSRAPSERQVAAMLYLSLRFCGFTDVPAQYRHMQLRFLSLTRQESECRFNTSLLYLFLVVSMENSGCAEINTQHRCFGFVCLFYPPQSLHVVMVWFSFNSKQTHLPANLNIIRGHYWKISRQTE